MKIAVGVIVFIVFVYTAGYAISLWKEHNKLGAFAVFFLAISIVITPFFSVFN